MHLPRLVNGNIVLNKRRRLQYRYLHHEPVYQLVPAILLRPLHHFTSAVMNTFNRCHLRYLYLVVSLQKQFQIVPSEFMCVDELLFPFEITQNLQYFGTVRVTNY